ncbi:MULTISPECIES: RNA chaperone Hfq [unclassified Clostridium]|jgi:host factor-I protein|uniref:RNA chaperone Hfq n=1 Tax=Clostridia TaxID=186801 RepID=UPI001105E09C|nr:MULTISPECIES: RNA chaperone Hfq [unclassified Clostridium]
MTNAKNTTNLQDLMLNQIRKEHILSTIHLVNGFQLRGLVRGFDNFVVLFECDGKQMMIYKHAISTVTPQQAIMVKDLMNTPASED